MSFYTDQQTLEDLNLLGKFRPNSVFGIFNQVKTDGGERLLEQFFREPMTDISRIRERSATFRRYHDMALVFPLTRAECGLAANYLTAPSSGGYLRSATNILYHKTTASLSRDPRYNERCEGLQAALRMLGALRSLCASANIADPDLDRMRKILADKRLTNLQPGKDMGVMDIIRTDHVLCEKMRAEMKALLDVAYHVDVSIAVSTVARERGFCYAEALAPGTDRLHVTGLRHPALRNAVPNSLFLDAGQNLLFLTGANMAGKSTFMKSYGIAVYLAHMGFPVPAEKMSFSIRDGLYTSINVPDNLQMGYSHFYAEVQRVKTVAAAVSRGAKLVVIFDELFKGTNVKDAYDATLAVSQAFGGYRACLFIISTHIIEVAEEMESSGNVIFRFLPTVMEGSVPRYTYRLSEGVSADRHGMTIIEQEGILDILG